MHLRLPNAPLFRDPVYDGAADPVVIWNRHEKRWWMFYTNRRANISAAPGTWLDGDAVAIASSADHGRTWCYRGKPTGLDIERGYAFQWAPEVIYNDGIYHMYLSYVYPHTCAKIAHLTSENLWDWTFQSYLPLNTNNIGVIDAGVCKMPDGKWGMWYKDGSTGDGTSLATSTDLYNWTKEGPATEDEPQEAPFVFYWHDRYFLLVDVWRGVKVYSSTDCRTWKEQYETILNYPGRRTDDNVRGGHPQVLVFGDDAYIIYYTAPEGPNTVQGEVWRPTGQRTSIQVAKLQYEDGKILCDRDRPFDFDLPDLDW